MVVTGVKKIPQANDRIRAQAAHGTAKVAAKKPGLVEALHDPETRNSGIRGVSNLLG